jgi:signal transduction histidine kinase
MKKKFFLIFLCSLLFHGFLSAQNSRIDSLKGEIKRLEDISGSITADTNLINAYYLISTEYENVESPINAQTNTQKLLDLTDLILNRNIASTELKDYLLRMKGTGYEVMGILYDNIGDYPKALEFHFKGLRVAESLNNKAGMLYQLINIGVTYSNLNEYKKALDYDYRALAIAKELKSIDDINSICGNIGADYMEMKNYAMALKYYNMVRAKFIERRDTTGIINTYGNLGMVYNALGDVSLSNGLQPENISDYDTAILYYKKALDINEIAGNKLTKSILLASLGSLYGNKKAYEQAKKTLLQSLNLSKEFNDLHGLMEVNERLSRLYSDQGDSKRAFDHFKDYIAAKDSIFSKENTKQNIEAEVNFEFEKKEAAQKAEHEKTVIALEAENRIQKNTRNFIVILAILSLLLVASGLVYFNNRKSLRLKELYSQQLLLSQEKERQRISKELHDSIGQNILFIKNQMIKNNDLRLMSSVDETLEEVRSISKDLYPNQLEKYGLVAAVDALAEKVKESSDIFVSYDLDAIDKNISADQQINYYRIIQECISNALKHSDASALRISASKVNGVLELVVQDNGKGFDKETLSKKSQRSFGLLNLEERTKYLKGKLTLETSLGNGTKYIFSIPS